MEFLKEALKGVENNEEIIGKIKKGIALEFVPKSEFNNKNEELKTVKEQLQDRDTQLSELKEKAKGNEELTAKIEELEKSNLKEKEELENKIKQYELEENKTKAILESKVSFHDINIVKSMLDDEKDYKEQLESIVKEKPFLVKEAPKPKPTGDEPPTGGTPPKLSVGEQIAQARNKNSQVDIVDPWAKI